MAEDKNVQAVDGELREEFKKLHAALTLVLEAFDKAFYGGNATLADTRPFLSHQSVNEVGGPIHEALALLRGENKEAPKKQTGGKTAKKDGGE